MLNYGTRVLIDGIFNAIKDLQNLVELSGVSYSSSQIDNLVLIIMNPHRILRPDVRKWIRKLAVEKVGANFKTHFTQAHIELRETKASAAELRLHIANALVDTIIDRSRTEDIINNKPEQNKPSPADISVPPPPPAPEQARAATLNPAALTTYMAQTTAQIANIQAQLTAAVAEQHQHFWKS